MSIQELEETLIVVGDEEVEGIKAGTETMFASRNQFSLQEIRIMSVLIIFVK